MHKQYNANIHTHTALHTYMPTLTSKRKTLQLHSKVQRISIFPTNETTNPGKTKLHTEPNQVFYPMIRHNYNKTFIHITRSVPHPRCNLSRLLRS